MILWQFRDKIVRRTITQTVGMISFMMVIFEDESAIRMSVVGSQVVIESLTAAEAELKGV